MMEEIGVVESRAQLGVSVLDERLGRVYLRAVGWHFQGYNWCD